MSPLSEFCDEKKKEFCFFFFFIDENKENQTITILTKRVFCTQNFGSNPVFYTSVKTF